MVPPANDVSVNEDDDNSKNVTKSSARFPSENHVSLTYEQNLEKLKQQRKILSASDLSGQPISEMHTSEEVSSGLTGNAK